MHLRHQRPIPFGFGDLATAQAGGNLPQRVPRGDLRATAPVHESLRSRLHRHTRSGAIGANGFETRTIDRLERQAELEARLRRGVEITGCLERALTFELGAIALEAEGLASPLGAAQSRP